MTWRTLLTLSGTLLLAAQSFTQALAWQAHYAPALGTPLVTRTAGAQRHGLYRPWDGLGWAWRWGRQTPEALRLPGLLALGLLSVGLLACQRQMPVRLGEAPPPATGHGTARWARRRDLRAMGLCARTGIVLGRVGGQILRFDGPENVLVVMGQRQGKGVGIFIPTLLEPVMGHVLVTDIRGETWQASAGYRALHSRTLRLELTAPHSARYNPLQEIRVGTDREYSDALLMADILVDPESAKDVRDHWEQTARNLLVAAILYTVHRDPQPSLARVAHLLSAPGRSLMQLMTQIRDDAPSPVVAELAQEVLSKDLREASGVLSSSLTPLSAWRNPVVAANTATSDWRLADFLSPTDPVSLYLIVSPADDLLIRTPLRLFLNQLVRRLTEAGGLGKARLTLLLDEFPFFGRLDFFLQHLSVLGGYGIRTVLAAQNVPQLAALYGQADRIIEQCRVRVYGAAQGLTTGDMISQQTGTTTATTVQQSQQRARGALWAHSTSVQAQQHGRPLVLPSEAQQIPAQRLVIQVSGYPAVWAQKVRFWRRRVWRQRSQMPVPGGAREEAGHA